MAEDIECWMRMACQTSWQFEGIPGDLTLYRIVSGGLSPIPKRCMSIGNACTTMWPVWLLKSQQIMATVRGVTSCAITRAAVCANAKAALPFAILQRP